jgi:hypothetical protein
MTTSSAACAAPTNNVGWAAPAPAPAPAPTPALPPRPAIAVSAPAQLPAAASVPGARWWCACLQAPRACSRLNTCRLMSCEAWPFDSSDATSAAALAASATSRGLGRRPSPPPRPPRVPRRPGATPEVEEEEPAVLRTAPVPVSTSRETAAKRSGSRSRACRRSDGARERGEQSDSQANKPTDRRSN